MKKDAEANAESDKKVKEEVEKLNSADQMIFQTEKQLKEFGEKLSDDKKKPIENALDNLKKAYESKDLSKIDSALEKINEAWKNASEEMYKAQADASAQEPNKGKPKSSKGKKETKKSKDKGDDVQDVDFEEVK
tara:strand:+ start:45 stop:446 length:402 start_codon:yes stop_codon:yes gene_type:complete